MMRLTPTQIQVLRYRRDGYVCSEIAELRGCSEHTVKQHERQIRCQMGVPRTRMAVRLAIRMGLI